MAIQNPLLAKFEAEKQKCFRVACDMTAQQFFDYITSDVAVEIISGAGAVAAK